MLPYAAVHEFEQDLEDPNSFLSSAINSAVKDLENPEMDETFSSYILQPDPVADTYGSYRQGEALLAMEPYPTLPAKQEKDPGAGQPPQFLDPEPRKLAGYQGVQAGHLLYGRGAGLGGGHSAGSSPGPPPSPLPPSQPEQTSDLCMAGVAGCGEPESGYSLARSPVQPADYPAHYHATQLYHPHPGLQTPAWHREPADRSLDYSQLSYSPGLGCGGVGTAQWGGEYRGEAGPADQDREEYGEQGGPDYPRHEEEVGGDEPQDYRGPQQQPQTGYQRASRHSGFPSPPEPPDIAPQPGPQPFREQSDLFSDYQIIEEVITQEEERAGYCGQEAATATKRYDPKHRALAQAFRKKGKSLQQSAEEPEAESLTSQCRPAPQLLASCARQSADCAYKPACSAPPPRPRPEQPAGAAEPAGQQTDEATPPGAEHLPAPSTAAEQLHTPEKSVFWPPQTPVTPESNKTTRPEPQQLFLTPKEKYAKEVSAQNLLTVSFDINQGKDSEKNTTKVLTITQPTPHQPAKTEQKHKIPTALKILKSKKKMASQKKLILEHGEVRLTQRQRLNIRTTRKLRKIDIFQPVASGEPEESDAQNLPKKKVIINRKDKLLAEHRSQSQNQEENQNGVQATETQERLQNSLKCERCDFTASSAIRLAQHDKVHSGGGKVFSCPFCEETASWNKEHYQHIQERHIPGPAPYKCPRCKYQNIRLKQVR